MSLSSTVREYKDIRRNLKYLLEGVVLAVDPSCGSTSSMPGWAVYTRGTLTASGTLTLDAEATLQVRLQTLARLLGKLVSKYSPDILVYEDIAPRRYGGGSAHGHASLLKSVGVVLSVLGPTTAVGLRPTCWRKLTRPSFVKGDEADAIEIGWIAVSQAREIAKSDPPRTYGGKSSKGRGSRDSGGSKGSKGKRGKVIGETRHGAE